jgi:hypothetical protein
MRSLFLNIKYPASLGPFGSASRRIAMDLYFLPLAGSLASRIALYEAGAEARYIEVDPNTKRTSDGNDFAKIYPLALTRLCLRPTRCMRKTAR